MRYGRQLAILFVAIGAAMVFGGLVAIAPIPAFIILAGVLLMLLGAFVVEVPQP